MFFHCASQLISIKLQLGYFDEVQKLNIVNKNMIKKKELFLQINISFAICTLILQCLKTELTLYKLKKIYI